MWYLKEECSPLDVWVSGQTRKIPKPGDLYKQSVTNAGLSVEEQWNKLSDQCCDLNDDELL